MDRRRVASRLPPAAILQDLWKRLSTGSHRAYGSTRERNTEPVALSSAVPTGRSSWALRPSAFGLWGRHRLTRAPCSVRAADYARIGRSTRIPETQFPATSGNFVSELRRGDEAAGARRRAGRRRRGRSGTFPGSGTARPSSAARRTAGRRAGRSETGAPAARRRTDRARRGSGAGRRRAPGRA